MFSTISLIPLLLPGLTLAERVGKLPALGWNSWNAFRCNINEEQFLIAANKMVESGLKDAGYQFVNIDDCWALSSRDSKTKRIVPDPKRFPQGIKGTADKIHALGLKIGIYSSAGSNTCERNYPGSIDHEEIDAQTWASWGIDYLKYDNCNVPSNWRDGCTACGRDQIPESFVNGTCDGYAGLRGAENLCPKDFNWLKSRSQERYKKMGDALDAASNGTIRYSLCNWGEAAVHLWGETTGATSWRVTSDIYPDFKRILKILAVSQFLLTPVTFYKHIDSDMLEIGNGNLSPAESRTHMAFWAVMKSPILIGTPMDKLSKDNVEILKNKYLLAFNQDDQYGAPAKPYKWGTNPDWTFNVSYPAEYWSGRYKNGTLVLTFNPASTAKTKTILTSEVPELRGNHTYRLYDAWTGGDLGCAYKSYNVTVQPRDTRVTLFKEENCEPK